MTSKCVKLADLLKAQEFLIRKNVPTHKWLRHIADNEEGIVDFINNYGWFFRQIYCGFACPERLGCAIAKDFLPEENTNT
jgi:hypothetical protein